MPYTDFVEQIAFISTLLLGFATAIVIQLVSSNNKTRPTAITIGLATTSTVLMLISAFLSAVLLIYMNGLEKLPADQRPPGLVNGINNLISIQFWPFALGLVAFLCTLSVAGWIYSRAIGIFTTLAAGLALVTVISLWLFATSLT